MTADRVDLFEADIAESPEALTRLLDAWQPVDLGADGRFVFTGLGSSRFAADVVAPLLDGFPRGTVATANPLLALATLLVHVINKQFFGWSIRMTPVSRNSIEFTAGASDESTLRTCCTGTGTWSPTCRTAV